MTAETVAVQIAASELCSRMEEAFEDEISREADCELKPYLSGHYGKIEANVLIALRELDREDLIHTCKLSHSRSSMFLDLIGIQCCSLIC